MPSLQGRFLIASPHLEDPNFMRAVILMVQHDEEGAFGLILNRPFEQQLSDVLTPEAENASAMTLMIKTPQPMNGIRIATGDDVESRMKASF